MGTFGFNRRLPASMPVSIANAIAPPRGDADRELYSENSGVALEDMIYSDFIINERWNGVEDALRGVYKEAEEVLGREFPYPGDE